MDIWKTEEKDYVLRDTFTPFAFSRSSRLHMISKRLLTFELSIKVMGDRMLWMMGVSGVVISSKIEQG